MANQQTAFRFTTLNAGPKGITKHREDIPTPQSREVLVRIHAVSLNYRDYAITVGNYISDIREGFVPGSDIAGEVIAVGSSATKFKIGDRVTALFVQNHLYGDHVDGGQALGFPLDGVLQEYRVFDEINLLKIPGHLTDEEATCFPIAGLTAWSALFGGRAFKPGEIVLCQGKHRQHIVFCAP